MNIPFISPGVKQELVTETLSPSVVGERGQAVAPPTSTEEQDRVSLGQRTVNLIWETTQSRIATVVVYSVLFVATVVTLLGMLPWATEKQLGLAISSFLLLSNLSTLVLGFYFGRTNHQKVGGVGGNDTGR